jgi:carbonic anhydrase
MLRVRGGRTLLFLQIASLGLLGTCLASDHSTGSCTWSYYGDTGPSHWATMKEGNPPEPCYAECGGTEQSPLDLKDAPTVSTLTAISFNYPSSSFSVANNGHTIQANYVSGSGSSISYNGTTYNLVQFHFHQPSEHKIDGENARMEVHLVHQAADKSYLVIGILVRVTDDATANPVISTVLSSVPSSGVQLSAAGLLPPNPTTLQYYTYPGSLTTPPCTQGITWVVLKDPITTTQAQINTFKEEYNAEHPDNNRGLQPLHDRTIEKSPVFTSPSTKEHKKEASAPR